MGRRRMLTGSPGRVVRALGLVFATGLAAACAAPPGEAPTARLDARDGHGDLACADCHDGPLADREMAQAPEATCTASGCHTDGGPRVVELASVVFEHRAHGGDSVAAMGCAGCHTHADGDVRAPLTAEVDACSFCHLSEQAAGAAGECRLCHENLEHAGLTSQGVDVPHDDLPWVDGGCVRCHYDVTEPPVDVSLLRCGSCHTDLEEIVAHGIGEDLHDSHTSASCISCHGDGSHRIRAMSSAVDLACVDCHREVHDVAVTPAFPDPVTCNRCHGEAHQAQQRLVLGLVDDLEAPFPSEKFMSGLTCRSCHRPESGAALDAAVHADVGACVACHRTEYASVERWWRDGTRDRQRLADAYLDAAERRFGSGAGPDARGELDAATRMLAAVREAGAVHNLPLSHRLLDEATERVARAYTIEGRGVPRTPDFGREPRMGLCSYCHYRTNDPWVFQEMSGPFHRDVLRLSGGR